MNLNEAIVEDAALSWLKELGYVIVNGPHLAPGEPAAERASFGDVVLVARLRDAIHRLNPAIPADAQEEALRKLLRIATPSLVQTNRAFHRLLRDGVAVEYARPDGSIAGTVKALRQSIPAGGQGAFITTADFQNAASDVALEAGFPRIGLVNGRQLVDLLVEHWLKLPEDFRNKLGLKPGLVGAGVGQRVFHSVGTYQ